MAGKCPPGTTEKNGKCVAGKGPINCPSGFVNDGNNNCLCISNSSGTFKV